MTSLEVLMDTRQYVTRVGDPDDPWDYDDTNCQNTLRGIKLSDGKYSDVPSPDALQDGDKVYLVWCEYSTGCTFCSNGGQVEYFMAFKDADIALRVTSELRAVTSGWSVSLDIGTGESHNFSIPWTGYFEHLEEVHCDLLVVGESHGSTWH